MTDDHDPFPNAGTAARMVLESLDADGPATGRELMERFSDEEEYSPLTFQVAASQLSDTQWVVGDRANDPIVYALTDVAKQALMDDADERTIWQESHWTDEGLSVTTYSFHETDPEPVVEDESYWTWSELDEMHEQVTDPEPDRA